MQFADASGVRIAWIQYGSGPDVLAIPPIISNVELAWEHERYRRFLEYQGRHARITAFDKRGIGLSDKTTTAPTLEERTFDIAAVMDAAGLDRATVLGQSEGGLIAQLFVAQHPERVERLVLVNSNPGASAFVAAHVDEDPAALKRKNARFAGLVDTWGSDPQYFVDWFAPSLSDDSGFVRWMGRYQRQSATTAELVRQISSIVRLDAAEHLADIAVPTIVIHVAGDLVSPLAGSRYLATQIPDSEYIEVAGSDHLAEVAPNWQEIADTWLEFATGERPTRHAERRLATVLFTDIVRSTASAVEAGDEAWRHVLDRHDRVAWELIDEHHGAIVKSTGDGILARFDSPSDGVEFGRRFRDAMRDVATRDPLRRAHRGDRGQGDRRHRRHRGEPRQPGDGRRAGRPRVRVVHGVGAAARWLDAVRGPRRARAEGLRRAVAAVRARVLTVRRRSSGATASSSTR